jgi:hypothetical protein
LRGQCTLVQNGERVAFVDGAADVDRDVLNDPRGARHNVDLLRRLDRARIPQHAADGADADWHRANHEAATTWRTTLLRRRRLGWDKEECRGDWKGCRHYKDGCERKDYGLIGGQPTKQWDHVSTSA